MAAVDGERSLLDALVGALTGAAAYNRDDVVAPAAVLWPDERREWEKLLPLLRERLPALLVLGDYAPEARTGPAIWLRCVLAGKVPAVALPGSVVPVIYLPGVSRATLRATEDCPQELKPLAELQYRGVFWSQQNAKDWTAGAFLQTDKGGLGLSLAKDASTAASLRRALERLARVPVSELSSRAKVTPLDSDYFDQFITDDLVDDLLTWLSDAKQARAAWGEDRWETLCGRCRADYGFDCVRDGELEAARLLGQRERPAWKAAWKRFAASPGRYPGLPDLLRRAKPRGGLFAAEADEAWPQDNDAVEAELRQALRSLAKLSAGEARLRLSVLNGAHGPRREWVWARLGRAPLAEALRPLAALADATANPLRGATPDDMISAYTSAGWQADAAALDAQAAVSRNEDVQSVAAAIEAIYLPWLRDAAELFQQRVTQRPLAGSEQDRLGEATGGTCVFFVDGLRYDLGQRLRALLQTKGIGVELTHHTSALPPVTPTAKPAVSPAAAKITGLTPGEEFNPSVLDDQKELTTERFRRLLAAAGYQVLAPDETGDPSALAWTEHGIIDSTGHNEGAGLARRVPEILERLAIRIGSLLAAGWKEVRVVTDHGWLLLPGGLPKADLPKYLVATRWGRCAVVKASASVDFPCFPWHWASDVRIACPHGIDCFTAGREYSHGGLSVQEVVVPQLRARAADRGGEGPRIEGVRWSGLRCRVRVMGPAGGHMLDLRDRVADASTSLTGGRPVGKDGTATLLVGDDGREGTATNLVLLNAGGEVVEMLPVNIGG